MDHKVWNDKGNTILQNLLLKKEQGKHEMVDLKEMPNNYQNIYDNKPDTRKMTQKELKNYCEKNFDLDEIMKAQ